VDLLRGITGFRDVGDEPLPASDLGAFRTHCFTAARLLSGRVSRIEFPSSHTSNNFASSVLELRDGLVAVVLNAHFPVIGFAEPLREGGMRLRFVDVPELAEVFRGFGVYSVVEASDFERSVHDEDSSRLTPAELKQIRYWKPSRVGDLVFNFWD
jgi:hypothetical protein